jgi:hypothetical protein
MGLVFFSSGLYAMQWFMLCDGLDVHEKVMYLVASLLRSMPTRILAMNTDRSSIEFP